VPGVGILSKRAGEDNTANWMGSLLRGSVELGPTGGLLWRVLLVLGWEWVLEGEQFALLGLCECCMLWVEVEAALGVGLFAACDTCEPGDEPLRAFPVAVVLGCA